MINRSLSASPSTFKLIYAFLLIIFVGFAYQNSLDSPFIFDDLTNIILNPAVQPDQVSELSRSVSRVPGLSYRPLASLSFAVNYLFAELNVHAYHLTNIIIHIGNALLLFIILILFSQTALWGQGKSIDAEELERDTVRLAFWGSILWALNPVQVHAVTYIVQRMTSLSTLFYLLSILLFLLYRKGYLSYLIMVPGLVLCFFAGMLCKEIMITMPLALVLLDRLLPSGHRRVDPRLLSGAVILVPLLGYYYLQGKIPNLTDTYPGRDFSGLERLMTQPRVLWHYLSVWFFPLPERLHMDYQFVISRSLWQPLTTLLSLALMGALAGWCWWQRRSAPAIALAGLFFLLASSVEASFLNLDIAFIHRLYLPSIFLSFGLLSLLSVSRIRKYALLLWLVVALLTLGTLQRNQEWNNRAEFWDVDYQRGASRNRSILNHSIGLIESNRSDIAIPLLEQILPGSQGMERMLVMNALGIARYHSGDTAGSIHVFESLGQEFGAMEEPLYYLGSAYSRLGQLEELKEISEELMQFNHSSVYGHLLLAEYLRASGEVESALSTITGFMQQYEKLPLDAMNNARVYLADIYLQLGDFEKAYALYNQVIEKDPHQFLAWIQIYRMLKSSGDVENLQKVRAYLESKQVRIPEE